MRIAHLCGSVEHEIALLIQIALARASQLDKERAFCELERALILAGPGGYVRTFVNEGEPLASLLSAYVQHYQPGTATVEATLLQFYVRRVMAAFGIVMHAEEALPQQVVQQKQNLLLGTLSEREKAVLALIAQGYSNNQIAQQLVVTIHTVKSHLHNIYAKMQVHTRLQAVVKAQENGLLEEHKSPIRQERSFRLQDSLAD